jgi:hypothetical protein
MLRVQETQNNSRKPWSMKKESSFLTSQFLSYLMTKICNKILMNFDLYFLYSRILKGGEMHVECHQEAEVEEFAFEI